MHFDRTPDSNIVLTVTSEQSNWCPITFGKDKWKVGKGFK